MIIKKIGKFILNYKLKKMEKEIKSFVKGTEKARLDKKEKIILSYKKRRPNSSIKNILIKHKSEIECYNTYLEMQKGRILAEYFKVRKKVLENLERLK